MLEKICSVDDVWEGEFVEFSLTDFDVLIVHSDDGSFHAFESKCPHQDQTLGDASFEGNILTCPAHLWQFDVLTGKGVNPTGCKLKGFSCVVKDDEVYVDTDVLIEIG